MGWKNRREETRGEKEEEKGTGTSVGLGTTGRERDQGVDQWKRRSGVL